MKEKIKKFILFILIILGVSGGYVTARITEDHKIEIKSDIILDYSIELSEESVDTKIETDDGEIKIIEAPTVESVDSGISDCPDSSECGLGKYIYAPTETATKFKDYTINKCWNTDDYAGGQCWDLGDLFWQNYAGRNLNTCGTGAAKGTWNCKEQNAGDDFILITDKTKLQLGDWVVFNSGKYGHIGMAMGAYNNGYIALLGQNQGGKSCGGGGSSTNIINISLNSFIGAFRPKSYIKPEPKPEPKPDSLPITGCIKWHVLKGDTMSKIMLECEKTVVYGEAMDAYAKTWYSLIYKPNQSVYDGWHSNTGVGLYAGDDIEHRVK